MRRDGLTGLRVIPLSGGASYDMEFPEPIYSVGPDANPEYQTDSFRLHYVSLVTPDSVYDCDLATGALSDDGTRVPISVVCKRGTPRDGTAPAVLYGYGSYEISTDPWFSIPRLSLVDRGVVFAVAHVRGGGELGRAWYDRGKMLAKKNTFVDLLASARHLVKVGWTSPERLVARGGSAGGLLVGAVANLAPDAFGGFVAEVPFVDALTTILDPSMPLTVTEWEEWGNPLADPEVYGYMKSD